MAVFVVLFVPKIQIRLALGSKESKPRKDLGADKEFQLEDEARKTWSQIVGGLAILIGFIFTYQTVVASQQAQETARKTQFSNSFATATDDLGASDMEARLGGIYALERLAEDSSLDNDSKQVAHRTRHRSRPRRTSKRSSPSWVGKCARQRTSEKNYILTRCTRAISASRIWLAPTSAERACGRPTSRARSSMTPTCRVRTWGKRTCRGRASYEPIATTVGEVSGKRIDTTADAPPGVGFLECVDPCVPLFKTRR